MRKRTKIEGISLIYAEPLRVGDHNGQWHRITEITAMDNEGASNAF